MPTCKATGRECQETIEVDKELYSTIGCLVIALMDKYCPDGEFIMTKEQRHKLICQSFITRVRRKTMDNLDDLYYIWPSEKHPVTEEDIRNCRKE